MAGGKIRKARPSQKQRNHFDPFAKSKAQNIRKKPMMLEAIAQKSAVRPTDVVLEIGPGSGDLTMRLLEVAKSVVAVEHDPRLVLELNRRFQGTPYSSRLMVIQGDVLKCDLPYFDICIANIPFEMKSPLISRLVLHEPAFRCAVVMFQHKFALRTEDKLSRHLSVNTQILAHVDHPKVGHNNVRPPPKVDSSVIHTEPRKPLQPVSSKDWDGLVRLSINRENKNLRSIFGQKSVLSLLGNNYKTLEALQSSQKGQMEENKMAPNDVEALASMVEDLSMEADGGQGR